MRLLIDILHPAHVHFFKNFIWEMEKKGNDALITTRRKDITLNLLDEYGFSYLAISSVRKGLVGMVHEFIVRGIAMCRIVRKWRPDLLISEQGVTTAPVGKLFGIPSLIFWDTEVSNLTNFFCYPLATAVYTPVSYEGNVWGKHILYKGYQKLAYLHPKRFTPNKNVFAKYKLPKKYCIVRFVSWTSNHDKNDRGFQDREKFVEELRKKTNAAVYITSESQLPPTLEKYRLKIAYKDMHDVLAFAALYAGESATMATEAAILGVPSLYVATSERGYINELQNKYGLVRWDTTDGQALAHAAEILGNKNSRSIWEKRRKKMLAEVIDVTEWMVGEAEKVKRI